jgi:hypothetical protein
MALPWRHLLRRICQRFMRQRSELSRTPILVCLKRCLCRAQSAKRIAHSAKAESIEKDSWQEAVSSGQREIIANCEFGIANLKKCWKTENSKKLETRLKVRPPRFGGQ